MMSQKIKKQRSLVWEMMFFISLTIVIAGIIIIATYLFSNSSRKNHTVGTVSLIMEDYYARNLTWDGVGNEMRKGRYSRLIKPLKNIFFVCDNDGFIVFPSEPARSHMGMHRERESQKPPPPPRRIDPSKFKKGRPLYLGNEIVGYLFIINRPSENIESTLIVIGVVILLTVPVCGIFIKQKLKPLDHVLKGAGEIGRGDYSVRVQQGGTGEIAQLIDQFNRMAQSIEDSDIWKKQIISDTAHELRTPITLLLSRLEMMSEGIYSMDKDSIIELQEDLTRLADLVTNLQKLSSLESKPDEPVLEEDSERISIPLFSLLSSFTDKFDPLAKEKGIQLVLSSGGSAAKISGNLLEIEQVLVNLFSNAIDFTPENGEIRVTLSEKDSQFVSLLIEDSGPGIPLAERENVFKRFYRLDKSRNRKHGGSGLGLTISRIIVERHGGSINLGDSALKGGGLAVEVLIPVKNEQNSKN